MAAIAVESVIKLVAFVAVAVLALSYLGKIPARCAWKVPARRWER